MEETHMKWRLWFAIMSVSRWLRTQAKCENAFVGKGRRRCAAARVVVHLCVDLARKNSSHAQAPLPRHRYQGTAAAAMYVRAFAIGAVADVSAHRPAHAPRTCLSRLLP